MMHLETERLLIRSLRSTDEKAFIEMASDGSLTEIFGDCSECHKWMGDFIKEAMRLELENNPNREYLAYAIEDKNTHTVIGSVGTSYYEDFQKIGVTYFIGAKFRGHGYAAEALHALVGYFLSNYPIDRLMATADARNKASCKTLERAGFQLVDVRPYQDMYNEQEELSHFYEIRQELSTV
ncbi:MAG: GNAT family N-acetyltransferase [Lachnospiraceae bacterium]|nr:GNAT family N-acetyltransferase [Lachnospiraceae bacterium]